MLLGLSVVVAGMVVLKSGEISYASGFVLVESVGSDSARLTS